MDNTCLDCRAWERTTPLTIYSLGSGSKIPSKPPFDGLCHLHAPIVLAAVSGKMNGVAPYGDGSSYGGGGSYSTKALTAFPQAKSDCWCMEFMFKLEKENE